MKVKQSKQNAPRMRAAFTLVEILMAVAISSVIFAGLFYGISQGYNLIKASRENLRATQIMVGRAEGLRLESWTQLTNTYYVPNTFTDYFYPVGLGGFNGNSVTYTGAMVIASMPSSFSSATPDYSSAMRKVTVTVGWQDIHANYRGTTTNSFVKTYVTYVAQNGIQNYVFNH